MKQYVRLCKDFCAVLAKKRNGFPQNTTELVGCLNFIFVRILEGGSNYSVFGSLSCRTCGYFYILDDC
jgi:hypothetical protein